MSQPKSLIEGARAFARDFPRDRMPNGYFWDLADYVPNLLDAQLTGRGGWTWASTLLPADVDSGIHAPYKAGDKLLIIGANGQLYDVGMSSPFTATAKGAIPTSLQNPVMHRDWVFSLDGSAATAPKVVVNTAGSVTFSTMSDASAPKAKYGGVYKDRFVVANLPGQEQQVRFSYPGFVLKDDPNTGNPVTLKWDANSFINSSLPVTGLGVMRSMILVFHAGSVERIRGSIPPGTDIASDMFLESLFDRAGCTDARSIAYWNDNCIFADERGVHLTDGSIVRNLISQGGLLYFWRTLYRQKLTVAAETYLDYYVITVRRTDGVSVTLICDLNRRAWFRFTNVRATCYIRSVGMQEKLWHGVGGATRLAETSNCFFPTISTASVADADGTAVLPSFETAWYRLGEEARKRIRHVYCSYDVREPTTTALAAEWRGKPTIEGRSLDPDLEGPVAEPLAAGDPILQVSYLTSPQGDTFTTAGTLLPTAEYTRRRMAVGKQPYGVAFRVAQVAPARVTRVFDLAVEAWPSERSRL